MSAATHLLAALVLGCPLAAQTTPAPPAHDDPRERLRTEELFAHGVTPDLTLELDAAARDALRQQPRQYARATLREGERALGVVGVKLKGAAGSFQEFDARPALTVHTDKFTPGLSFHGLVKFHLNNSVQDESLLCEWLGSEVFRAAGYAAPRVTHAHVAVDDRDLGIYVLKEGFDRRFLERNFGTSAGSLYDGGFCQDVDAELEKDVGDKAARSDLQALAAACRERDPKQRQQALGNTLDLEAFVTFAALERMLGHWDGYVQTKNNYRLWFDAAGKGRFLPHGMDQLLGDPEATVLAAPESLVGAAVLKLPAWRTRYRSRLLELLPVLRSAELRRRLEQAAARVRKLAARGADDGGSAQAERTRELQQRLDARVRWLEQELHAPEPKALALRPGEARPLVGWLASRASENARLDAVEFDGSRALEIASTDKNPCTGSWRCSVLLPPGRYRVEARARSKDVVAGADGGGVQLRRSGQGGGQRLLGTQGWQTLGDEFALADETQEVVLVAELHAASGRAWFRRDAFRLVRLPD